MVALQCNNGGICTDHVECVEGGTKGFVDGVYMDGAGVGDACVPQAAVQEVDVASLVIREFRRISWPESRLSVQPPGGETLVNLDTIFFTTNAARMTRTLTLAGRSVVIGATPISYAWHFGDGADATTSSPGRAYPDQDVVHAYASAEAFTASVDTTYAGRFRIGQGGWQRIEETLTVGGTGVGLEALEAKPQLVR